MASGVLVKWTKGFSCSGVEGEDVCHLLREAIARRGDVKINVCAILNDTTGCLMSSAWKEANCRIGLILGTGTNACYLEHVSAIGTLDEDEDENVGKVKMEHMVVNTEWGAFGDNGELDFCRTKWDRNVDEMSVNPGKQVGTVPILGENSDLIQGDPSPRGLVWVDLDLGCSTVLHGQHHSCSTAQRPVEHPKSKSTQPRSARRWVSLYLISTV